MSSRARYILAGVIGLAASASHTQAQVVQTVTVTANVPDIGVVVSAAPLQWTGGSAESAASGTVGTKHNGPYRLQVRLTSVQPDTILARLPDGSYGMLDPDEWTTVATGPGGTNSVNSVEYRIRWRTGGGPQVPDAPIIPLIYRVVLSRGDAEARR
jgi:hypothetical protein